MADRDVTIKLNLRPGDSQGMGKFMVDAMSQAGREVSKQLEASRRIVEGMTKAGQAAELERVAKLPSVLPTGLQSFFGGGGIGKNLQQAGIGYIAQQAGGVLGGAGGGALSLAGRGLTSAAAGFAAGGPIGAAIALIPIALQALKGLASVPFNFVGQGLQNVTTGMRQLAGPLGAGGALLTGMSGLARQIPLVGEAIGGMIDSLKGFIEQGVSFVRLFSPGTTRRFGIVQEDTLATIGRTFTPVLESLTDFMRLAGDFLATVLPGIGQMRDALSPLRGIFGELKSILSDVAPILKQVVTDGLWLFKTALTGLYIALQPIVLGFKGLATLLGISGQGLQSSAGLAAREIHFGTPESSAKEVYQAAFRAGAVGDESVAKSIPELLIELITGLKTGAYAIQIAKQVSQELAPGPAGSSETKFAYKAIEIIAGAR